ncbi:hypothetical protein ACJX0J_005913, partial [Zea mays]
HYHITAFLSLLPCSSSFLLVTSLYQILFYIASTGLTVPSFPIYPFSNAGTPIFL